MIRDPQERQAILLRLLEKHPSFRHPVYLENIELIASETQINRQEIDGESFLTVFLTHGTMPAIMKTAPDFSLKGTPRFFKSIIFDGQDDLVSVGMPHFFNLEKFRTLENFAEWSQGFRFIEKHDGTCVFVTRYKDRYLLRSRRRIYRIADTLDFLNFGDYALGDGLEKAMSVFAAEDPVSLSLEAIFPHPALRKVDLPEFFRQVIRGAGFCPFVDYPSMNVILTGVIHHNTYRLESQDALDRLAQDSGLRRPAALRFESLDEADKWLKKRTNHEGFCVYFDDDQAIFKFKTRWYQRVRNTTSEIFHLLHQQWDGKPTRKRG